LAAPVFSIFPNLSDPFIGTPGIDASTVFMKAAQHRDRVRFLQSRFLIGTLD